MDILIKSFNRPYYLDRCLYSIQKHITGYDRIYILDDGTPQKYLDKITQKYTEVKILKSALHQVKSTAGDHLNEFKIPIDFWVESANMASDHFLLLEDDIWVVEDLDLKSLGFTLKNKNVVFLKLFWLGNPKLTTNRITEVFEVFNMVKPRLLTGIPFLFKLIFRTYGYGFNKLVGFFKLNAFKNILPYYSIYSVAGAIFKKSYFTCLWQNHDDEIDESLQLFNALHYLKTHPESQIAHGKKEYFKTGFCSSATFGVKKSETDNMKLLKVNRLLNEAWMKNEFAAINSLPKDLKETEILDILNTETGDLELALIWEKWVEAFKQKYRKFGCKID
ncbi:glycosyltransferase family protein [Algibacter pacificus]|uniref:hypothetical protein n=1 Tax=Algibacter pacificus TaxID=2599389 RepID=UPI0011CBB3BC|nr:hypothetical protein [Algibacter pacificus]